MRYQVIDKEQDVYWDRLKKIYVKKHSTKPWKTSEDLRELTN